MNCLACRPAGKGLGWGEARGVPASLTVDFAYLRLLLIESWGDESLDESKSIWETPYGLRGIRCGEAIGFEEIVDTFV